MNWLAYESRRKSRRFRWASCVIDGIVVLAVVLTAVSYEGALVLNVDFLGLDNSIILTRGGLIGGSLRTTNNQTSDAISFRLKTASNVQSFEPRKSQRFRITGATLGRIQRSRGNLRYLLLYPAQVLSLLFIVSMFRVIRWIQLLRS